METLVAVVVAGVLDCVVEALRAWVKFKLGRKQLPEPKVVIEEVKR